MKRSPSVGPLAALLLFAACAAPGGDECAETAKMTLRSRLSSVEVLRSPLTASDVVFEGVEPDRLIPGTVVRLVGQNLAGEGGMPTEAQLDGTFSPTLGAASPIQASLPLLFDDEGAVAIKVDDSFTGALGAIEGRFEGSLSLRVSVIGAAEPVERSAVWTFDLLPSLAPDVFSLNFGSADIYPGDAVPVDGDGFLLPGEGTTTVRIEGTLVPEDGGGDIVYAGGTAIVGALEVEADRRRGILLLAADVFPPTPGLMQDATVSLTTELSGGLVQEAPIPLEVTLRMNRPFISGFSPDAPGRGERVTVEGRGFLPLPNTLFELNGRFHPDKGDPRDVTTLSVLPDTWIDGNRVQMGMLTQTAADGSLIGLAAQPGRLEGTVTPILVTNAGEIRGLPWQDGFRVGPTKQMVWIRYLPTFVDTLQELFGLGVVEREVRGRVREVAERDYAGFNVFFVEDRPSDHVEFSIIEVGGPDPNDLGLFGLDNTMGKDTQNIRLDDIVAGKNSESAGEGYPGFGGVFVESFVGFSPQADEPLPVANDRFDEIFAPFAPFLCGEPVTAVEAIGGGRTGIDEAVRVFGNVVGNTVVHEIGHSLGLTQSVAGKTAFHNLGDNGNIMDAGTDRSFFERAELDGEGPSTWHPVNREYLGEILPKPAAIEP